MISFGSVTLRVVERSDLEQLKIWRNRPDFRMYFREYQEINSEMQESWFINYVVEDRSTLMFSIFDSDSDELVGACGLCYINWVHRNADLSLYIGKDNMYIDNYYAIDACNALFKYGFDELGLKKIWTEIYDFDNLKKDLYTMIGMQVDGILRKQYFYDGTWRDSFIMSITLDDYISRKSGTI